MSGIKEQINKPKNWQDFEDLCLHLWRSIWGDPNAQKNGRPGQKQHGVDVWGRPYYSDKYCAVQCKQVNQAYGTPLTIDTVKDEANNVEFYNQENKIDDLIVATSSNADAKLLEEGRALDQSDAHDFKISIWNWDMIEDELNYRPDVYEEVYKQPLNVNAVPEIHLSRLHRDEFIYTFFTRTVFRGKMSDSVRLILSKFFIELRDNSMRHGFANEVCISYNKGMFSFVDDGKKYDIRNLELDGNGGHKTYMTLKKVFGENVEFDYVYCDNNIFTVKFSERALLTEISPITITIDRMSRTEAERRLTEDIRKIMESTLPVNIVILPHVPLSGCNTYLRGLFENCKDKIKIVSIIDDPMSSYVEDECKRYGVPYTIVGR